MEDEDSQCHPWSKVEINLLIELVIQNKALLEGKHGPSVTEARKRMKWQEIVSDINACGVALRTVEKCKKKLRDIKKGAREYLQSMKVPKTGGGKPKMKLWYYDLVLDHIIGRESPYLYGVADGVRAGLNGLFGSEEPTKGKEISGGSLQTLKDKCKRQKSGEDQVHQIQVHHDGDAESNQSTQLQINNDWMAVDVYTASNAVCSGLSPIHEPDGNPSSDSHHDDDDYNEDFRPDTGSPLNSTSITTGKSGSTSKHSRNSSASQVTATVKKKAPATSAQRYDADDTLRPSSGAHLQKTKKKESYDNLVALEIKKTKAEIQALKKKEDAQEIDKKVQRQRDQIALQRERLLLKRDRVLFNLQIEREKVKLELDRNLARKAQLEVEMLEGKGVQPVVMTMEEYNDSLSKNCNL